MPVRTHSPLTADCPPLKESSSFPRSFLCTFAASFSSTAALPIKSKREKQTSMMHNRRILLLEADAPGLRHRAARSSNESTSKAKASARVSIP